MEALFPVAVFLAFMSLAALVVSPVAGMTAVFVVKPFIDASYGTPLVFDLRLTEVYSALIAVTLLAHMALAKGDTSIARMPLNAMWLVYSVYIVMFSMLIAYSDDLKSGANVFFRYINGIVGFYFLQAFFRQGDRFKWFLLSLILGGLFPIGLGVYQGTTGVQWREEQAEGLARTIGIWHDGVNMRTYAEQTILALLLYTALYVKADKVSLKAMTMTYIAASTVVMLRVYSKAAIVTCGLWLLCWTILRRKFAALGVLSLGAVLVALFYAGDLVEKIARLFHKEVGFVSGTVDGRMTFHGRWFDWIQMMDKWERLPSMNQWFGSGQVAIGAHNDFLQMLFHGGLVGLMLYSSLLIVIGVRIVQNLLARSDEMAVAALMAYLMWLIDSIGLVPSAYPAEQWLIWGIIGISFRIRVDETRRASLREPVSTVPVQESAGHALAGPAVHRRFPLVSGERRLVAHMLLLVIPLLLIATPMADAAAGGVAWAAEKTFAGKRIIFEEDVLNWTGKEATDKLLARIKRAGFDIFSPNVWHGRGATWPSKYAEWDSWLKPQLKDNYDPLKYLIERAHGMGIEVHPWLNLTLREGDILPQFAPPGTPATAFDVHMPEFRHFMANLIVEIVSRYDVDGINLDYVRAVGLCSSDFCKADYQKRYGRSLSTDTVQFKLTFGRMPATISDYQESDVTALVQEITQRVRAIKPNLVMSADVIPLVAGPEQGQNSIGWANAGLVDVLCRMAYYRDIDAGLTEKIRSLLNNPDSLTLVISSVSTSDEMGGSNQYYSRDGKWFAATIDTIQRRWPQTGVGVYMYKWLSDEQIAAVKAGPFKLAVPKDVQVD